MVTIPVDAPVKTYIIAMQIKRNKYMNNKQTFKAKVAWFLTKLALSLDDTIRVSYEKDGKKMIVAKAIDQIATGEAVIGYYIPRNKRL